MNGIGPANHYEVGESTTRVGLNVEYRVRTITRYIVTRYESVVHEGGGVSASAGLSQSAGAEYNNYNTAYQVAYALAKAEHERLGYRPDDMRIQYPQPEEAHRAYREAVGLVPEERLA